MKKRYYYTKLMEIIENGHKEYKAKAAEYAKLKQEREEGHFSMDYLQKVILPEMSRIKSKLDDIQWNTKKAIAELTNEQKKAISALDRLNAEELTADAELLKGGYPLKVADLEGIIERNAGNRTMEQLVLRYAEEHGLPLGLIYERAEEEAKTYDAINYAADTVVKWYKDDECYTNVLNSAFGDGSAVKAFIDSEE
ncbi:MAG: hypothetical protein IKQ49_00125 [Eubacterium sp.]|nr:hypothetical protein [Eubacterium sp.]